LAKVNRSTNLSSAVLYGFSISFFLIILAGCAGQIGPSGGPIDKTPPQIVYSSPSQKQLNFNSDELEIRFDKYMSERAVENAIYFPPFSSKEIDFDWSGKELTIKLRKPLEKDRTYILTIGAGAQDTRNNSIGKAVNLVFSTGSKVDTGIISGTVFFTGKAQAYTVAAFSVTDSIDTLRPSMNLAKYVTQSDDSGRYIMQGLAAGKYRLVCFDDQMRNFTYAIQMDNYASATHDIEMTDSLQSITDMNFMPATEDTSRPQLYSADLAKDGTLLLKFSEMLDSSSISPRYFYVRDSVTAEDFPVDYAARREDNKLNVTLGLAKPLPLKRTYLVTATENIRDLQSNKISPENNPVVLKPDSATVRVPQYYFNFSDSVRDVNPHDTLFCQIMSPAISHSTSDTPFVSLVDSTGSLVPAGIFRQSESVFKISLQDLKSLGWYSAEIRYRFAGSEKDSVMARSFRMIDFATLGDIEGEIIPAGKKVVVLAASADGKKYVTLAGPDGKFHIGEVPAATFTLGAYVQHNNGIDYYSGKSFPYKFAEPFGVYPDPVKVRARWTSEGVKIRLF